MNVYRVIEDLRASGKIAHFLDSLTPKEIMESVMRMSSTNRKAGMAHIHGLWSLSVDAAMAHSKQMWNVECVPSNLNHPPHCQAPGCEKPAKRPVEYVFCHDHC